MRRQLVYILQQAHIVDHGEGGVPLLLYRDVIGIEHKRTILVDLKVSEHSFRYRVSFNGHDWTPFWPEFVGSRDEFFLAESTNPIAHSIHLHFCFALALALRRNTHSETGMKF